MHRRCEFSENALKSLFLVDIPLNSSRKSAHRGYFFRQNAGFCGLSCGISPKSWAIGGIFFPVFRGIPAHSAWDSCPYGPKGSWFEKNFLSFCLFFLSFRACVVLTYEELTNLRFVRVNRGGVTCRALT